MAGRPYRVARPPSIVGLLLVAAVLTGCAVARPAERVELRVLQMNLCNSGMATGCYTGRAVGRAAEVIRAEAPDIVTLNEVCSDDVDILERVMTQVHAGRVVAAFQPARNGRTGEPYRCVNGQRYGVGVLAHIAAPYRGHTVHHGFYPAQDPADPEQRAWLCLNATGAYHACTTHLAYTSAELALAQCAHLLGVAVPQVQARSGQQPTVVSGDLNLRHGGSPDVRSCVPADYRHRHDGGVQQVMVTADSSVESVRSIGMDRATDHAAFLVTLAIRRQQDPQL
ncbi:endonuclease/exonuclease/phosphatase family protein [Micromonospora fiedleri]|uniref:Endonuclease/exonuclease/phosphatase family protein n=1 Tax=Micromonospora fiedleri TaxID=1157498 RepID=A0ABS1UJQ8_9ACTN|nr:MULTISPECIES: endonuclease/exonuclease/phosphatase family protein [Micromonospora]MBL6276568.1 endonuclease/exonuclease/phosphatase family protein [Micromonospora fiedleri]WSK40260.1 endonuclease/exonuclease/phosphatase family protein [Micromonospora maris]